MKSSKVSKMSLKDRIKIKRLGELRGEISEYEKILMDAKKYGVSEHRKAIEWVVKDRKKELKTLFREMSRRVKSS
jgi:hypothetical protein